MTFTVTYRGADGAVRTEAVEAANRAECISQMRARGISPMGVREGANHQPKHSSLKRSNASSLSTPQRLNISTIIIALLALAVVGGVWWWLGRSEAQSTPEPEAPNKPSAIAKDVKPAKAAKQVAEMNVVASTDKPTSKMEEPKPEMYMGKRVIKRVERTNAVGRVKAVLTTEDGLTHRVYVDVPGNDRIILNHGTDHVLAAILSVPAGTDAPPVPVDEGMEAEFLESLKEPIEDMDTDTPEEHRLKEIVRQGRKDMKTLMDQGMSFRQIILEHQAQAKENSTIRLKIIQEAARIRESHGVEEEHKYRTMMNAALERMGIAPVGDGMPHGRGRAAQTEEK